MWVISKTQQVSMQAALSLLVLVGVLAALAIVAMLVAVVGLIATKFAVLMLVGLVVMIVAIAILIGLFFLVGQATPVFLVGAIALLILVVGILLLEIAIMLLVVVVAVLKTLNTEDINTALKNLKTLLLGDDKTKTEGLISVLCGCAGHILEILSALIVMALITVVSVLLTVIILLFLANAAMLKTLGPDGIKEAADNIKLMINSFIDAVDIFSGKGLGGSAKLLAKITGAVIVFTELMIIAGCITAMAAVIQHIATLDMEEFDEKGHPTGKRVKMTDNDIITGAEKIRLIASFFTNMMTPGSHDIGGITIEGLDLDAMNQVSAKSTAKMVELMAIVGSIGKMAETVQKVASLSIPTGFDKDGNPTGYRQMEEDDFIKATTNIGKIALLFVSSLANPIEIKDENGNDITGGKSILDYVSEFSRKETKRLKAVFSIGDSLSNMVDAVIAVSSKMEGVQLTGEGSVKQTLTRVVSMMMNCGLEYVDSQGHYQPIADVISQVNKNWADVGKAGGLVNSIINDFTDKKINIEDHKKFIDENIKFLDKANSVDVDKIQTVTEMFGQMTELSASLNGNIEDLAKTLSEDLVDALNKLNEAINNGGNGGGENPTPIGGSEKDDVKNNPAPSGGGNNPNAPGKYTKQYQEMITKLTDISNKLSRIHSTVEDINS